MTGAATTTTPTTERIVPLIQAAAQRRLTREQLLRRALRDGTAIQVEGKWYVREVTAQAGVVVS